MTKVRSDAAALGKALAAEVSAGKIPIREIAGRTWSKEHVVRAWCDGTRVPNSAQWGALKGIFSRLSNLDQVWHRARYESDRAECEEEASADPPRAAPSSPRPAADPPRAAPSSPRPAADAPPPPKSEEAALRDVVDLLRSAIPQLRRFSLTVDDAGEASVEYEMRVVISGALRIGGAT